MAPSPKKAKEPVKKDARTTGKKRRRTPKKSYAHFINKVLKQVHPTTGISKKAMTIMDDMVHDLFERLASATKELNSKQVKKTVQVGDVQQAVKLILPGELSKHGISEGTKSYQNYLIAVGKEPEPK